MATYAITVTQTRDAVLIVEGYATAEHAREYVRSEFPYAEEWDEWEDGYNIWISDAKRLED